MPDQPASRSRNSRRLRLLSCLSVLVLGASQASALSEAEVDSASELLLAQDKPLEPEPQAQENSQTLFAVLEEVLEATQAKLEELSGATAILADSDLDKDVQALKQENGRLVAELEQARTRQTELESSNELAEARIAQLTIAVDAAVEKAAQVDWELAELRRENAELEESLARAHAAREASEAKAAELDKLREQFEVTRQKLVTATSARQQLEARASEREEALVSSGAETARLKTELAEAKEQLGQAVGAVIQAEQARQAATAEVEPLRAEVEGAREELATARINIERVKTANTELREQLASWHVGTRSAVATAVHNLVLMEQKIEELNAALALTRVEEDALSQADQESPKDEDFSEAEAPSRVAPQPPAPEVVDNTDAPQPVDSATELSPFNW